jgi:hypothetical protein
MTVFDKVLNECTSECKQILTEAIDFKVLGNTISDMKDRALYIATGNTRRYFDKEKYLKYKSLLGRDLSGMYVVSYPNIYMFSSFKMSSPALIDYVVNKIKVCAKYGKPFIPNDVREESFGILLRDMTGKNLGRQSRLAFRDNYQRFALGSVTKVRMRLNTRRLLQLMYHMPDKINYVENSLLNNQAKHIEQFINKLQGELEKIAIYNPDMAKDVHLYKEALVNVISDMYYVYKVVKNVLVNLNDEYYKLAESVYSSVKASDNQSTNTVRESVDQNSNINKEGEDNMKSYSTILEDAVDIAADVCAPGCTCRKCIINGMSARSSIVPTVMVSDAYSDTDELSPEDNTDNSGASADASVTTEGGNVQMVDTNQCNIGDTDCGGGHEARIASMIGDTQPVNTDGIDIASTMKTVQECASGLIKTLEMCDKYLKSK